MIDIFYFDNTSKKAEIKDIEKIKSKPLWIDITNITKDEADVLSKTFELHPLTVEDLINLNTRIKTEDFPNYLFCIFYSIEKKKEIVMKEIDMILGQNFVITSHKTGIDSFNALKANEQRLENLFKKGLDFLFHRLLDLEIDNFFPVLESIDDEIEKIEDKVAIKVNPSVLKQILHLKRIIVNIKRTVLPQREKISFLAKNEHKFISKKAIPYFRDVYDHAIRVSDTIDNYREAVANTFDVYMSSMSNNMNEVMKILSVIATIALPLTVISGIYGTNFAVLPGQHFAYGFWVMILAMALLSVGMIYFFRRRNWF